MTDEECQKLCERLRRLDLERDIGIKAADEIERLAEDKRQALNVCERLLAEKAALAQSDADDPGDATWRNLKKRMDMGMEEAIAALTQSDAEPNEKIKHKCHTCGAIYEDGATRPSQCKEYIVPLDCGYNVSKDGYNYPWDRPQSDAEPPLGSMFPCAEATEGDLHVMAQELASKRTAQSNAEPVVQTEFELEDGLHELAFPAPPRPDASAGLIEAAEWQCPNCMCSVCVDIRSRAADRSGK